jgi:hypothetical protein
MTTITVYKYHLVRTKKELAKAQIEYSIAGWTKKTCVLDVVPDAKGSIQKAAIIAQHVAADVPVKKVDYVRPLLGVLLAGGTAYTFIPAVHYASIGGFYLFSGIAKFAVFFVGVGVVYALIINRDFGEMTRFARRQLPKGAAESERTFQTRKRLGRQLGWMPGCGQALLLVLLVTVLAVAGYAYSSMGVLNWNVLP